MDSKQRIGVLGGSFDPPHLGHLGIAEFVASNRQLDKVLFVVANIQWQKAAEEEMLDSFHRLAMVEEAISSATEVKAIVPKKTLTELRNLGKGEEMLFSQDKNHLFFKVGHRVLASRVIEGQFPSYEKVIPPENPLAVVFTKETMAGAIRRVSLLASERSRAVKFTLSSGEAIVSSSNPELGEAKESVAVQYEGSELEVCFNAQYILDFLTAVEGEEVVLRLKDPASQGLLEPHKQSSETSKYKCVIMPMRI